MAHDGLQALLEHFSDGTIGPEATPARDIAGIVLRQQGTFLWDAGHLDGVAQFHRLSQLNDSDVIPQEEAVPLLMDVDGVHLSVHGAFLILHCQIILPQAHTVDEVFVDAVGGSEDVAGGDETAPTGVPPCVILEVLKRDLPRPAVGDSILSSYHSG